VNDLDDFLTRALERHAWQQLNRIDGIRATALSENLDDGLQPYALYAD
jgi:hypothetical protein